MSEYFLDDIVEHDAEVTASEGITADDDGELQPGRAVAQTHQTAHSWGLPRILGTVLNQVVNDQANTFGNEKTLFAVHLFL